MMGVAVEQMLDLWWTELRQVKAHLRALFPHPSVAASAAAFLDGLLGPERRKTGWMRAEAAGIRGRGAHRRCSAAAMGTQTPCATWCARTQSRRLLLRMRARHRRDRLSQAGPELVWGWTAIHRIGGQDHPLSDRRVGGLCLGQGLRLYRPPA